MLKGVVRGGGWLAAGSWCTALMAGALVGVGGCAGGSSGAGAGNEVAPGGGGAVIASANEVVYSDDQADRGETRFTSVCAACHATAEFTGEEFWSRLAGAPVFGFYDFVRTNMPWRNPNTLTREQYAEVVAYIIRLNGFAAGTVSLPSADVELRAVTFPGG